MEAGNSSQRAWMQKRTSGLEKLRDGDDRFDNDKTKNLTDFFLDGGFASVFK